MSTAVFNYAPNPNTNLVSLPPSPPYDAEYEEKSLENRQDCIQLQTPTSQLKSMPMQQQYSTKSGALTPPPSHASSFAAYDLATSPLQPRRGSTGTSQSHHAQPNTFNSLGNMPLYKPQTPKQRITSPTETHSIGQHVAEDVTLSGLLATLFDRVRNMLSVQAKSSNLPSFKIENKTMSTSKPSLIPSPAAFRYAGLCALWYTSSALSSNTGKSIMARFRYPVTLTLVQFGFVAVYCILFCGLRESLSRVASSHHHSGSHSRSLSSIGPNAGFWFEGLASWGIRRPSKQALHGTLIMSFFQIAGHVFSSMAISRIPVSTVHTIKALSPLFTVLSYAILFRVRYSPSTYTALVPLTLGVMLACSFDLRANMAGLVCALGSTVIFVSQNIFSKKLLPKESSESASPVIRSTQSHGRLDKVNLLLYSSGMAFLLMIPIWIYTDFKTLLQPKPTPPEGPTPRSVLLGLFLVNGSVHFAQCLLAFSILARSSPVAYSIASLIKRVAVICLAIVWFGQQIGFLQGFGMAMTFGGLWMYNRAKSDIDKGERKRGAIEKRQHLLLPTTNIDARILQQGDPSPDPSPSTTPLPPGMSPYASRAGTPPVPYLGSRPPHLIRSPQPTEKPLPLPWTPQQLEARLTEASESTARNRLLPSVSTEPSVSV